MDKFTPGPWYATSTHVQSAFLDEDNYVCMAEGDSIEQAQANAVLIAGAPDMLAVLRRVIMDYEDLAETGDGDLFDERLASNIENARAIKLLGKYD